MKPKVYISTCQTVERLLNVTSQVSLRDLAVKFDCLEAEDLAREVEGRWVLCEGLEAGQLMAISLKLCSFALHPATRRMLKRSIPLHRKRPWTSASPSMPQLLFTQPASV